MESRIQVVWFKRDLRLHDHPALTEAALRGPVLPLFIIEPGYWQLPDHSARHWHFCRESLADLQQALADQGMRLLIRTGDVPHVLSSLKDTYHHFDLWSHEETGNHWTYQRDLNVARWCRESAIKWTELPQNGVIRRLENRDLWARQRDQRLHAEPLPIPPMQSVITLPDGEALPDTPAGIHFRTIKQQPGGREAGLRCLNSFLDARGQDYRFALSSPNTAYAACSRVSPHLCWGTLSVREVYHASLDALSLARNTAWKRSLRSFISRLYWHCHFMQKLEDRPDLEWAPIHPLFAELDRKSDRERLERWAQGMTGWPFVDACMRALNSRGWINFRMRAMLTSVASYQLWLPWQDSGQILARTFIDYEPGIHWPQIQMQSGTTGINALRIYNPLKQGQDLDPDGRFMRRWLPELADAPVSALHEPRLLKQAEYPAPMVDLKQAAREAKSRITVLHQHPRFNELSQAVYQQLGSRKSKSRSRKPRTPDGRRSRSASQKAPATTSPQLSLWD